MRETEEALEQREQRHMEWSHKQSRILTCDGKAEEYFTAQRGFPFRQNELPHHYLGRQETHTVFREWRTLQAPCSLIVGVWNRRLFVGGWHHSTDNDEHVYNIQTNSLFIDLRIPKTRDHLFRWYKYSSLEDLSAFQLRLYARQHIFAGFSVLDMEGNRPVCTRHHCIDWNYVGCPRPRPNKWWIEMSEYDKSKWKEYAYATDDRGQHYYCERWELREYTTQPRLALRKASSDARDGIIVIVGDHFNYVLARTLKGEKQITFGKKSLVDVVDAAVEAGDLTLAREYLGIEGGHGRISQNWALDCAIPPWNQGKPLWEKGDVKVEGHSLENCQVLWKGEVWELYDYSFQSLKELQDFLS